MSFEEFLSNFIPGATYKKKKEHSNGGGSHNNRPKKESNWREKNCPGVDSYCGVVIKYCTDWDNIPDLCPTCRQKAKKANRPEKESPWREKSCPGVDRYCGLTIKYRTDWANIPTYCESCRNREYSKPCSIRGCDHTITYKVSYTNVRDVCGRCYKEMERGRQPRVCTKCNKVMFVAPGKEYTVCRDCNLAEQIAEHEALRRSVQGRRISATASDFEVFAQSLIRYMGSSDEVFFVDLDGAARQEWKLPPMKRGERVDGGFDRGELPYNYPTIDLWTHGDATSIKSLDLGAPSYRNLNALDRRIAEYIDQLARFPGSQNWKPKITKEQVKSLTLLLVVPLIGARDYQLNYLYSVGQSHYAQQKGVKIIVFIVD